MFSSLFFCVVWLNWNETEQKSSWNLLRLLPDFKPTQIILLLNFNKYGGLFVKHFLPYSPSAPQCSKYSKRCMGNEAVWRATTTNTRTKKKFVRLFRSLVYFNAIQYYRNGDINWRVFFVGVLMYRCRFAFRTGEVHITCTRIHSMPIPISRTRPVSLVSNVSHIQRSMFNVK